MSTILPGRPQSRLQALASAAWAGKLVNTYITGNAFSVLEGHDKILQTIYDNDASSFQSIAIDVLTGTIAVSTKASVIKIFRPSNQAAGPLKWTHELSFDSPDGTVETTRCLSWGRDEELLVGTDYLSLYAIKSQAQCIWRKKLPSAANVSVLSFDSGFIASVAHADHSPKIWRRLSYEADGVRFDMSYLQHPDIVTTLRWRKPLHVEQSSRNVLYTTCKDALIRIWVAADSIDELHWHQLASINTRIVLFDTPGISNSFLTCIIDGRDFISAVERVVQTRVTVDHQIDDMALDHLVAIANKTPDICLAIYSNGLLVAWALEDVGALDGIAPRTSKVLQIRTKSLNTLNGFVPDSHAATHIEAGVDFDMTNGDLQILVHSFDGRIGVFTADIAELLSPTHNEHRLLLRAIWSGHSSPIEKMVRSYSGSSMVSRSTTGECILWEHVNRDGSTRSNSGLRQLTNIPLNRKFQKACILQKGRHVFFLENSRVSLWDCRLATASLLAQYVYSPPSEPLCLINLPGSEHSEGRKAYIAMIMADRKGLVWQVNLPSYTESLNKVAAAGIELFCSFELDMSVSALGFHPVDPAGTTQIASSFLDVFAQDVAISYTSSGRVDFWTARIDHALKTIEWLSTCHTETAVVDPTLATGSMLKKVALVDATKSRLTIWDIGGSRLEFEEFYEKRHTIQDLDWTSTPDGQSILAVGFSYQVLLLSQMRFDYLNEGPAWAQIRKIDIRDLTSHPIGDSTWLSGGYLVTGAGNQLFVHDRRVERSETPLSNLSFPHRQDGSWDIFEAVQRFNGPLPVFHPQFLSQCVLSGKATLIRRILAALSKALRSLSDGELVDDYLGISLSEFYYKDTSRSRTSKRVATYLDETIRDEIGGEEDFDEQTAVFINERLANIRIPQLSRQEQIQLMDMVECVALVERHRRSMDENGARFMLFFRQHALQKSRTIEVSLSWREINWAYHSNSQDILNDLVTKQVHASMTWNNAREYGIFMWLSDTAAVRTQFEIIARNEYIKNDRKSPVDCSLFYLALKKKTVLQGLWRMASGDKEQAATQRLLSNDFDDPRWQSAALKNAYALLSKRRFQYAAAFFLLAGNLDDAIDVCLKQLKDLQLAIAVARVYGGENSVVLKRLLQEEVLNLAALEGDRWLASWAFWMLGRKDMAVRALITPVYNLLETPGSPDFRSRSFLTDDPAVVLLYSQLRHQTLKTLRGASRVKSEIEWSVVLHSAKLYDRMGCDLLGLDLVRNWEFQKASAVDSSSDSDPFKLLQRRNSLVVNDLSQAELQIMEQSDSANLSSVSTFHEPEAGALLDSFGL